MDGRVRIVLLLRLLSLQGSALARRRAPSRRRELNLSRDPQLPPSLDRSLARVVDGAVQVEWRLESMSEGGRRRGAEQ